MPKSRKLGDLLRDPRFALHGPTEDPIEGEEAAWPGEAKISGRAVYAGRIEAIDGGPEGEQFVADIDSVVITRLDERAEKLVVEWWTPGEGRQRIERA